MRHKKTYLLSIGIVTIVSCGGLIALRHVTIKDEYGRVVIGHKPGKKDLKMDGPYVFNDKSGYKIVNVSSNGTIQVSRIDNNPQSQIQCFSKSDSFSVPLIECESREESEYVSAGRILAISDIEGNFHALKQALLSNKVIDTAFNWIYGNGHLVINGDIVDRGDEVTECLWLVYKLEQQAKMQKGHVHLINGNHEEMNFRGNVTYVALKYRALVNEMGITYKDLYSEDAVLGKWMKQKNILVKIDSTLFCHGGIHPDLIKLTASLKNINSAAIENFGKNKRMINSTGGIAAFIFSNKGPMWYRGYFLANDEYGLASQENVEKVCNHFKVKSIVVGHTVRHDIQSCYNKKVIGIDVIHPNKEKQGECKALLIENGKYYKVSSGGRKILLI